MLRWPTGVVASLILFLSMGMAQSAEDLTNDSLASETRDKTSPSSELTQMQVDQTPTVGRAIFPPVTPEESERVIHSRPVPADLTRLMRAAHCPASNGPQVPLR